MPKTTTTVHVTLIQDFTVEVNSLGDVNDAVQAKIVDLIHNENGVDYECHQIDNPTNEVIDL